MNDTIRAALIGASTQVVIGLLTMSVAISALNSWRRNALGTRQLELAEQCLQAVWQLDEHIKAARLLLAPSSLAKLRSNDRVRQVHVCRHEKALAAMRACSIELGELKKLLRLSEIYLGEFPRTRVPSTARIFKKIPYSIDQDYDEIIAQLIVCLMHMSAEVIESVEVTAETSEDFERSAEMFYGFMYEYEQDDYSVRLRISRTIFERHVSRILKRRRIANRFWDKLYYTVSDRYHAKFKPVTVNRDPLTKTLEKYLENT